LTSTANCYWYRASWTYWKIKCFNNSTASTATANVLPTAAATGNN
jgi:hypothetical protein